MEGVKKNNSFKKISLALAFSGASALIYEISATELLFNYFNNNIYSATTVLVVFLSGLGLGSFLISKYLKEIESKEFVFVLFQLIIGFYALIFFTNLKIIPYYIDFIGQLIGSGSFFIVILNRFLVGSLYLLLPAFLFGASLPLACSMAIKEIKEAGSEVGYLYSWDLLGSIAGVLLAGFLILPLAGLKAACFFGGALNFTSAFILCEGSKKKRFIFFVLILIVFVFFYFLTDPFEKRGTFVLEKEKNQNYLKAQSSLIHNMEKIDYSFVPSKNIIDQLPSPYGVLQVIYRENDLKLYINHKDQCGKKFTRERTLASISLENCDKKNIKILVVGLGCGLTLDSFLEDPRVLEIDVVEINPEISKLVHYFFEEGQNPLENQRVNLIIGDGFDYLKKTEKKYDIISVDIEDPLTAHSSPLYTLDFFRTASKKIENNGVFSIYGYSGSFDYLKTFYDSLNQAFSFVYLLGPAKAEPAIFLASFNHLKNMNFSEEEKALNEKIEQEEGLSLSTLNHQLLKYYYGLEN